MDENELKKRLLRGKKTERVVFATSEEMKAALEIVAEERCVSVSALLTDLAVREILGSKELFRKEGL